MPAVHVQRIPPTLAAGFSCELRAATCPLPSALLLISPALPTRAVDPASPFLVLCAYTGKEVVG